MKYWFIVYQWWCPGSNVHTGNDVWQGEHPLHRLMEMRALNKEQAANYNYTLIFYDEIDEALFHKMKHRMLCL